MLPMTDSELIDAVVSSAFDALDFSRRADGTAGYQPIDLRSELLHAGYFAARAYGLACLISDEETRERAKTYAIFISDVVLYHRGDPMLYQEPLLLSADSLVLNLLARC